MTTTQNLYFYVITDLMVRGLKFGPSSILKNNWLRTLLRLVLILDN